MISSPRNNASTTKTSSVSRARRSTRSGVASLTVAGHGVIVGPGGIFGTDVPLKVGKNIIAATAANLAGNQATAAILITYKPPPCKVPKLHGKTLRAARAGAARNTLRRRQGQARAVKQKIRSGRVVASKPRAGTTHTRGYKVRLVISRGSGKHRPTRGHR